jgi:hypothetical protein
MGQPISQDAAGQAEIAIRVRTIAQLFNSFDPSPFRERDIDTDVEQYILDWVRELPPTTPFTIVVHLPPEETARPEAAGIAEAFRNYFAYRARVVDFDLRELFRVGRRSLAIGVTVLVACLSASQLIAPLIPYATLARVVEESLIIVGWVANWRPIEIYLYEWWPIRRRRRQFARIAAAPLIVRAG